MFHNIFSKKQIKTNQNKVKPRIIADIHEKDSMIFSELKSNQDIELTIQPLKIGDYLIEDIIIERKTTRDFISSMLSRRLADQLSNMRQYPKKLLIIEGSSDELYNKKLNPNAVRGFILSIITNYETNIIFTNDYRDTAQYLITLSKQQLKPRTKISLHNRIPKTIKEQKQYILEAFPNIGPIKAELLLKKFKTLSNVFNASEEELNEILKNQTKNFKEILNS
jgi:ERCC4-type nuclease